MYRFACHIEALICLGGFCLLGDISHSPRRKPGLSVPDSAGAPASQLSAGSAAQTFSDLHLAVLITAALHSVHPPSPHGLRFFSHISPTDSEPARRRAQSLSHLCWVYSRREEKPLSQFSLPPTPQCICSFTSSLKGTYVFCQIYP